MTEKRYIILKSLGQKYALPLEAVAEIMDPPPLYPVPKAPGYYRGIMNCHGRPVPVLDLARLYRGNEVRGEGKILVLESETANLALHVDRVVDIVRGPIAFHSADHEDRVSATDDDTVKLIEPEELLTRLETEING